MIQQPVPTLLSVFQWWFWIGTFFHFFFLFIFMSVSLYSKLWEKETEKALSSREFALTQDYYLKLYAYLMTTKERIAKSNNNKWRANTQSKERKKWKTEKQKNHFASAKRGFINIKTTCKRWTMLIDPERWIDKLLCV